MRFHLIAIIVLTLFLAYLLNFVTQEPVEFNTTTVNPEQDYDFFMNDVDTSHFNLTGTSKYRIQALRSTHYPSPEYTLLEAPNMIIYQEESPPWFISSRTGKVEKDVALDQDRVELIDDVLIQHTNVEGETINIYTDFLTIYPNIKLISTDREVVIQSPGIEIVGLGMTANLEHDKVTLLADVRGRYYE